MGFYRFTTLINLYNTMSAVYDMRGSKAIGFT